MSASALQVFDKDDIGVDVDTAAARIELSNETLLALCSVGCNVNGVTLITLFFCPRVPSTSLRFKTLRPDHMHAFDSRPQQGFCCCHQIFIRMHPETCVCSVCQDP
jgi:hypothetical protein